MAGKQLSGSAKRKAKAARLLAAPGPTVSAPSAPFSKKPSGAQFKQARMRAEVDAREAERARGGINDEEQKILARLGPPPLDPILNAGWINNGAVAYAWLALNDPTIPREQRIRQYLELSDRAIASQSKAVTAKALRELRGEVEEPARKRDAGDIAKVGRGTSLRARSGPRPDDEVRGPVPEFPGQGREWQDH